MEIKEEIRSRLNIEDVIGGYVQLKRAGRNFKGLSPFSHEKTPSFIVSPDKQIWHDFSSNKGGDVFRFIMEAEGVDFRQALEILARRSGVDLAQYSGGDRALSQKKERLYSLLNLAANFYQHCLVASQPGIEYVFKQRGISKTMVQSFRIGYAPDVADNLTKFLLGRGYKAGDIVAAGMAVTRRGRLGDMFRGRMMVPLCDGQGRVTGFTARLIDGRTDAPKYINTPQTLLYDKGRQVFGLHLAKEAVRKRDRVVIVEGNLDVIASHQVNVNEVVATAGTAMTDYQLRSLGRLSSNIVLAYDRDQAGVAATERAIGVAGRLGLRLKIVNLPEGFKDPDELIKSSAELWAEAVSKPTDAVEWLVDEYARHHDLATAEGKRVVTDKALSVIEVLPDPVEREHYLGELSERLGVKTETLQAKMEQVASRPDTAPKRRIDREDSVIASADEARQDLLLALLLVDPDLHTVADGLKRSFFSGKLRQLIFGLIEAAGQKVPGDGGQLDLQSDVLRDKVSELELIAQHQGGNQAARQLVVAKFSKQLQISDMQKQKTALAREMDGTSDQSIRQEKNRTISALNNSIRLLNQQIKELK